MEQPQVTYWYHPESDSAFKHEGDVTDDIAMYCDEITHEAFLRLTEPVKMIWSWSAYEAYMTCPRKYAETWLKKNFVEDSEQNQKNKYWGEHVHRALEKAVGDGQPLPDNMKDLGLEARIAALRGAPGTIYTERKLGLSSQLQPCDFFDKSAVWLRTVVDYTAVNGATALALDYKTGKRKLTDQLRLTSLVIFHHHPEVQTVHTGFMWLQLKGRIDPETYHRKDMVALWGNFEKILGDMKESHRLDIWPTKRNGLCEKYCPVTTCPYNGNFRPEK